jgi:hypothetical protein
VTYDAFTSTSVGFGFHGNIRELILSKHGKPIANFNNLNGGEGEVLFPSHTRFRVLDWKQKDFTAEIILEEMDQ